MVEAVDTTGAGDAFLGALAARLRSGDELAEAVGAAVLTASRSVTLEGSIPSYGSTDDVVGWPARATRSAPTAASGPG